jgi:hypothetical protein
MSATPKTKNRKLCLVVETAAADPIPGVGGPSLCRITAAGS